MFVSIDGKAKEIKEIYAGGTDEKTHKITSLFGSVNGIAKQVYSSRGNKNAFDMFSWAEIKQMATNGQLLEYFHKYDRVTVKLNKPVTARIPLSCYDADGKRYEYHPKQDVIIFQITELTATKMKLSSPYASVFYRLIPPARYENDGFAPWTEYEDKIENNGSLQVTTSDYTVSCYWQLDSVLPDDLKSVVNGYNMLEKKVSYSTGQNTTTNGICHVRNISEPITYEVVTHEDIPRWYELAESQFPLNKSAYNYHISTPLNCVRYSNYVKGRTLFYSTDNSEYYRKYYYTDVPQMAYDWGAEKDKYKHPGYNFTKEKCSQQYYNQSGGIGDPYNTSGEWWDYLPEISIGE